MDKRQTSSGHLHDPLWIVTLTQGLQGNGINTTFRNQSLFSVLFFSMSSMSLLLQLISIPLIMMNGKDFKV